MRDAVPLAAHSVRRRARLAWHAAYAGRNAPCTYEPSGCSSDISTRATGSTSAPSGQLAPPRRTRALTRRTPPTTQVYAVPCASGRHGRRRRTERTSFSPYAAAPPSSATLTCTAPPRLRLRLLLSQRLPRQRLRARKPAHAALRLRPQRQHALVHRRHRAGKPAVRAPAVVTGIPQNTRRKSVVLQRRSRERHRL